VGVDLLDPVLSLLDRQVDALADQQTMPEFLVFVEPFLRALEAEPRIAIHLDDLRDETLDRVRVLEKEDSELVPKFIQLRIRLARLSPDLDDSDAAPPSEGDDRDWIDSLAQFDAIAAAEPEPLNYKAEGARSQRLVEILRAKREGLPRPHAGEIEAWVIDLHNLSEVWSHATRWLALSMRVSAGLALLRLESVPPSLNPKPAIRKIGEKRTDQLNAALQRQFSVNGIFFNAVHTDVRNDAQTDLAEKQVAEMRAGLTRLSVELHWRIGATRSRRALILRFKQRCEWHDATRLREVADTATGRGGIEDRLTGELARFLFDQGLNPLTKPLVGGLEPDLLDSSVLPAFYVEAKQYDGSARSTIRKAFAQILDTVGRLQTVAYSVHEAFCVVFRRGGPRYELPEAVQAEGYRVYFTLIDIAPPNESGARQKHRPIRITEEEMLGQFASESKAAPK
jgi:hypothetical protein